MPALTTWVKPPQTIKGLDPLGVRVPCELTYSRLVPGITNVTDRARYYSFYPWLIWAIGQRYKTLGNDDFIETFRRADCLFTLIGAHHGESSEEDWRHGGGLVGRSVLLKALREIKSGKTLRLSTFAGLEDSPERYFKNKLGGLGQYYLPTLRDLGIIAVDSKAGLGCTPERGRPIAEAFDKGVPQNEFLDAVEGDRISLETLKSLEAFCPCNLMPNSPEHQMLVELFFNRHGIFHEERHWPRTATLGLMLDLVARPEHIARAGDVKLSLPGLFRACAYAGALPDGSAWTLPESLAPVRQGWGMYQRNELLSVAIQGIFCAALTELGALGELIENREAFRNLFIAAFADDALWHGGDESFAAAVNRTRKDLPNLTDRHDEGHELQLGQYLLQKSRNANNHKTRVKVVQLGVRIILALAARLEADHSHDEYFIGPEYVEWYPINLPRFRQYAQGVWQEMTVRDLSGWLATEWGLDVHLRVALRKLRNENLDTFRVRPVDEGLQIIGSDLPEYTNPRLRQVCQILFDLGAMDRSGESKRVLLTPLGHSLLEECRG